MLLAQKPQLASYRSTGAETGRGAFTARQAAEG